jgi:phosphoglycolate phosphatase-like HAD superfamily hydrolase
VKQRSPLARERYEAEELRLVLFDIDGTLIDSGGAGIRSLNLAFEEYFSVKDAFTGINLAGKTDIQIMREGLITDVPP